MSKVYCSCSCFLAECENHYSKRPDKICVLKDLSHTKGCLIKTKEETKPLLEHLKEKNIKPYELAKELDVHTSLIYKWNRNGVPANSIFYPALKKILPELEPVGLFDNPSKRYKKKNLDLYDTALTYPKEKYRASEIPQIIFEKE